MLIPRIITAVVLLAILAVLISLSNPVYFAVFISLASALTIFEWLRISLNGTNKQSVAAIIATVGFATFLACYFLMMPGEGEDNILVALSKPTVFQANPWSTVVFSLLIMLQFFVSFVWIFIVPMVLYQAQTQVSYNSIFHSILAVFAAFTTWFTVLITYVFLGAWFLLSFLIIIWCADIFAYFGGKHFGGEKLAPAISPGKTRSGAICGLISVAIWMVVSAFIENSFSALLVKHIGLLGAVAVGVLMAVVSIFGDLYESLLKRRAGVKDSSQLLPGHGGFWDRLDSVVAVSPIAMCFVFLLYIQ
ncbi:phosphatidate cytidylyltransferase [Pelistega suis]|uniref:phosphatidate cytidylyltransferase n=1 Tax=Pelistega suis TaxID=1631957 RepID=UPI00211D06A4|nr:phosphatidate cytidylyltransferase [Pelistega suis]MCQ9328781.1 phosphatidate cytidylyltransferase [Pelistega suis]